MAAAAAQSVAAEDRNEQYVPMPPQESPFVIGLLRILTAISAWLVIGSHIYFPNKRILNLGLPFWFSLGIIVFCAKVRGTKVFARTPVDVAFVMWLGLAVVSQLWAMLVLNRVLVPTDLFSYLSLIVTTWLVFRCSFALCCVDPRTATGAFLKAIFICLGVACLVGILQGYGGPLKSWAINFGVEHGTKGDITALQFDSTAPRPVALFSGPNFFGFMNLIGMCVIMGMTMGQGKSITSRSVWLSALAMALFLIGTLVAQSRFAIATALVLVLLFMYMMFKVGQTKVVFAGVGAVGAIILAGFFFIQQMDLTYLESTFQRKITDDGSYRLRELGFMYLQDQAIDLAPLGGGYDSAGYDIDRTGDIWSRTNSIDNGYLQAFINHGIPGVLHLLFLFWSLWWAIRLSKGHPYLHIRVLRLTASLLFVTYLIYSLSGVRHAKLETGVYWMIIFGLLYGALYGERWFGVPRWRKAPAIPVQA
jgi:O-antigen ligase